MTEIAPIVLVVDDEPFVLTTTTIRLRRGGYEAVEAINALEALAILESRGDIAAILSDCNMPPMSGPNFARIVLERWPHIAFLAMSGRPRPADLPDEVPFLQKPFKTADLLAAIGDAIAKGPSRNAWGLSA